MPHTQFKPTTQAHALQRLCAWAATPLGIAVIWALVVLPSLRLFPLFNDDEGAFSEATREMLQSGDWISTTLNGAPRFDKPILIYWLQALSVQAFGLNEFALRLPSALAATFWTWAIARFAMPRLGWRQAVLAAVIGGTSLGVLAIGRSATADALLNLLIALSLFDLWRHLELLEQNPNVAKAALLRAYLWIGLGVLTKGPVAVLIPGAVTLLYCLSTGQAKTWLRMVFYVPGWLLAGAVCLPWYALEYHRHGQAFIDGFFVRHNLNRFHGTLEGHHGSIFYYALVAPLLLLPWSALIWAMLRDMREQWQTPLHRYLLIWFAFVLVFFSFSGTKLPHYLMYGLTPVFLLLATQINKALRNSTWLALPLFALGALFVLPWGLSLWATQHANSIPAPYLAQANRAQDLAIHSGYYLICIVALMAALRCASLKRKPAWIRAIGINFLIAICVLFALTPWLGTVLQDPVKKAALLARDLPQNAVQWNYSAPSFALYREQITPARPPQSGELAITRVDRLPPDVPVDVLFQEGGIALVLRKPDAVHQ